MYTFHSFLYMHALTTTVALVISERVNFELHCNASYLLKPHYTHTYIYGYTSVTAVGVSRIIWLHIV